MKKTGILLLLLILSILSFQPEKTKSQNLPNSLFRMAEGFVRIAEPGVFADTLSIFGDVNAPGRYIVPRGTKIHQLLGYARGPLSERSGGQGADWSKVRVEITVSKLIPVTGRRTQETFRFRYDQEYPEEYTEMPLGNDYIVSLEVKRRPAFIDYVRVFSTVVSATATTIIIVDRLQR